jgi:iron complex outermembrane receptor protein
MTADRGVPAIIVSVVAVLSTLSATRVRAQPADSTRPIETMDVLGSHLGDRTLMGLSPVLTFDRLAIERSGVANVSDLLQQLPMDNAGTFNDRDALSQALGGAGISLRGLGADSALILINGRRVASYGFPQVNDLGGLVSFVDLASIPLAAVERIEVLKDGASAIYGSDALAGVVNIVLRQNFSGTSLELREGTARNGAKEQSFSAISGWTEPRTNVEVVATYTDRQQLAWANRSFSATANRENQGGADLRSLAAVNFWVGGVGNFGADCEERNTAGAAPAYHELAAYGICVFDPNAQIVVPSARRTGLMTIASHELSEHLRLHLEASYLKSNARGKTEAVPWDYGSFPSANPWNPFGEDVLVEYRFSDAGPRLDSVEADNARLVFGLEGEIGDWRWEYSALVNEATTENQGEGYLSADRIEQALDGVDLNSDGVLQPEEYLNLFSPATNPNSAALINSLKVATLRRSNTSLKSHLLRFARRLLRLRTGDLFGVFGVEHTGESLDDQSDPLSLGSLLAATTAPRNWFGLRVDLPFDQIDPQAYVNPWDVPAGPLEPTGAPSTHGTRWQNALFGEVHIPILPKLDVQAALRYEDVIRFGGKTNPRVALRFDGFPRARIRASWGKGFRAPSLVETHLGPSAKLQASWDPKRCPEPGFLIPDLAGGCAVRSFVTTTWGNPDLMPERSESTAVGIDIHPFDKQAVSLDCWQTKIRDKIMWAQTAWLIRHEDDLPSGFIVRDPNDVDMAGNPYPGSIAEVNLLPLNFGRQDVDGCDLEVSSKWDGRRRGAFEARLLGTHMASNKLAFGAAEPLEELAGTYGYPKNRATLNLVWSRAAWEVGLRGHWTDAFDDTWPGHRVAAHREWDTQLSYSGWRMARITFGVDNLLDEAPPLSVGTDHLQGFPVQFYDMRGRFAYAEARFSLGERQQQGSL